MNLYGVHETNPINDDIRKMRDEAHNNGIYDWNCPLVKQITRLRLLSDRGFPYWDVSYCYGITTDGKYCLVSLPFHQIPKRGMFDWLKKEAKRDGVNLYKILPPGVISTLI